MTVAGIWLRVSSDKQDEQNQLARIEEWIRAHGYIQGKVYQAHDKSASKREHLPLLREAIADMKSGLIDVLAIRNTDRIDRTEDLGSILKEVKEAGGRIESVDESWVAELSGLPEKLMTSMTEWKNAEYVKNLSANVSDAQARRRSAGSFASGVSPRGYAIVGTHADGTEHPNPGKCQSCYPDRGGSKTLIPDADAGIIKRIFEAVAAGDSYLTVARALQKDHVPTRDGGAWATGVIGQIIRNPTYRGIVQHKGQTYMMVEPIVSSVVWKAANDAVAKRAKGAGKGGGRKSRSFLRPVCVCGGPMYVYNNDPRYAHYRCAGIGPAGNSSQGKPCGNTIKVSELDAEVTAEFENADDAEIVETVISGSDYAEEIAAAQLAIKDLDVMADDYDDLHAELVRELRRLRDLPSEPAKVTTVFTGRSEGDAFKEMERAERMAFIRLWTLTVYPEGTEPRWKLTRGEPRM